MKSRFERIGFFIVSKKKIIVNKKELIAGVLLALVVAVLVIVGWMPLVNMIGLAGVVCLAMFFRKEALNRWIKVGVFILLVPLVFFVATYRPEGFSYPLLLSLAHEAGSEPRFEMFVNFSKLLVGVCLLFLLWPRLRNCEFVASPRWQFLIALLAPALIVAIAIPVLGLRFQPKAIEHMLLFALVNLFVIALAEEAFMRLLLQQTLRNAVAGMTTNHRVQELLPLLLVTVIFVAIHAGLSGAAIWIYALAGFLYGLSYSLSKNILYPIIIHFLVNQLHFSFLTYPL